MCETMKGTRAAADSPRVVIETPRLHLREVADHDAAFILSLVNEPGWLRYIGDRGVHDTDSALAYIRNGPRASYARHGFGLWLIERRADAAPLGLCGLLVRDYLDHPDIGFALRTQHHGQGYAREAAAAVLDHAHHVLELARLLAIVSPGNERSVHLLRQLGFGYLHEITAPGATAPVQLFGLSLA
jgi:ribosomal-protein-alanine N-acetyltransferase